MCVQEVRCTLGAYWHYLRHATVLWLPTLFLHRTLLCAVLHCVANASVVLRRDVPFCVMSCQALCCLRTTFCMRSWDRWGQA